MKKSILIEWQDCIELVEAKLGLEPINNEINQVINCYPSKLKSNIWETTSERHIESDKSQTIIVQCSMDKNSDQVDDPSNIEAFGHPDHWYWGSWTITVAADLKSAKAVWNDNNQEYSGEAKKCTVLSQELLVESGIEFVFMKIREQAQFRKLLLKLDLQCAITGENNRAVLEAAHIVDKSDNGAERIINGILLRVDIHRLYDAGFFEISEIDGSIEKICHSLSEDYQEILKDKKLRTEIFSRVKEALAERARLQQGR